MMAMWDFQQRLLVPDVNMFRLEGHVNMLRFKIHVNMFRLERHRILALPVNLLVPCFVEGEYLKQ